MTSYTKQDFVTEYFIRVYITWYFVAAFTDCELCVTLFIGTQHTASVDSFHDDAGGTGKVEIKFEGE